MINNLIATISGGKNKVIQDRFGNPNVMVKIDKFNLSDVIVGAPNTPHPAFIVGGKVKEYIYVSKYTNSSVNGVPCSLPNANPLTSESFDSAKNKSADKGEGWSMMSNSVFSAIALLAQKNKTIPSGNNNRNVDGVATSGSNPNLTLTGSGPKTWSHNNTVNGIYDLAGNTSEWVDGIDVYNGEIRLAEDALGGEIVGTGTYLDISGTTQLVYSDKKLTTRTSGFESYGHISVINDHVIPSSFTYLTLFPHGDALKTISDYCRVLFRPNVSMKFTRGGDAFDSSSGMFSFSILEKTGKDSIGFRTTFIE